MSTSTMPDADRLAAQHSAAELKELICRLMGLVWEREGGQPEALTVKDSSGHSILGYIVPTGDLEMAKFIAEGLRRMDDPNRVFISTDEMIALIQEKAAAYKAKAAS